MKNIVRVVLVLGLMGARSLVMGWLATTTPTLSPTTRTLPGVKNCSAQRWVIAPVLSTSTGATVSLYVAVATFPLTKSR